MFGDAFMILFFFIVYKQRRVFVLKRDAKIAAHDAFMIQFQYHESIIKHSKEKSDNFIVTVLAYNAYYYIIYMYIDRAECGCKQRKNYTFL